MQPKKYSEGRLVIVNAHPYFQVTHFFRRNVRVVHCRTTKRQYSSLWMNILVAIFTSHDLETPVQPFKKFNGLGTSSKTFVTMM